MEREKLKTIVIDIPNKVFEINGTPIPKDTSKLNIAFENGVWEVAFVSQFNLAGEVLRD